MSKSTPAIILAAGESSRLGTPKALVKWGEETLVARANRLLQEFGCKPIIVVTRKELQVDVMLNCPNSHIAVNKKPEDGRTGTLQLGLMKIISEMGRTPRRVLVVPVDRCGWNIQTLEYLSECETNTSPNPSGHPLMLCDIDLVLNLEKDSSLRDSIEIAKIDAPGRHLNIDTPDDLEALQ